MGKYGDDDNKVFTIGGEVEAGAKTATSIPMTDGGTTKPALEAHALVGPTVNFQTNGGPLRISLLGGIGGDSSYLDASSKVTIGDALNMDHNPTDPKSIDTNKKFQISDNAAHLMGKVAMSYNQDGWVEKGINGSLYATGTHALGTDSTLPKINTAQVGGDIGFSSHIGHRDNCRADANYLNLGVGAQTTVFSSMPNDPNLNKVSIKPYIGLSKFMTNGLGVYGKAGAEYTPGTGAVIPTVKLGVRF